jgi:serine/threonine protein kinase
MDIKPANFLINDNNDIRLTDFGIDWCCNSEIEPICDRFKKNKEFLKQNNNKEHMLDLLIFSFASNASMKYNIIIFQERMTLLFDKINKDREENSFFRFIQNLCSIYSDNSCGNLPAIWYVTNFFNYNENKNKINILNNIDRMFYDKTLYKSSSIDNTVLTNIIKYFHKLFKSTDPFDIITFYLYSPDLNDRDIVNDRAKYLVNTIEMENEMEIARQRQERENKRKITRENKRKIAMDNTINDMDTKKRKTSPKVLEDANNDWLKAFDRDRSWSFF